MCSPGPFSGDFIGIFTIVAAVLASAVSAGYCHVVGNGRTKAVAGAWLSYGFTACPLVMVGLNALLMMVHRVVGACDGAAHTAAAALLDPTMNAGGPTLAFSAGYAIIHLTADLHRTVAGP